MAKQDDYVRYTIRIPADLYAKIQASADASGRSVNAQILVILQLTMEASKGRALDTLQGLQQKIERIDQYSERFIQERERFIQDKERLFQRVDEMQKELEKISTQFKRLQKEAKE